MHLGRDTVRGAEQTFLDTPNVYLRGLKCDWARINSPRVMGKETTKDEIAKFYEIFAA